MTFTLGAVQGNSDDETTAATQGKFACLHKWQMRKHFASLKVPERLGTFTHLQLQTLFGRFFSDTRNNGSVIK